MAAAALVWRATASAGSSALGWPCSAALSGAQKVACGGPSRSASTTEKVASWEAAAKAGTGADLEILLALQDRCQGATRAVQHLQRVHPSFLLGGALHLVPEELPPPMHNRLVSASQRVSLPQHLRAAHRAVPAAKGAPPGGRGDAHRDRRQDGRAGAAQGRVTRGAAVWPWPWDEALC